MKRIYTFIILLGLYATVCAQVSTQNYVRTRTLLNESGSSYMDNVVYYDGLGRSFQAVQKGITPTDKKNLITLQEYDAQGRECLAAGKIGFGVSAAGNVQNPCSRQLFK